MQLFAKKGDRVAALNPPFDSAAFGSIRTIVWNSTTNVIPALTPPVITLSAAVSTGSATVTITCDVAGATIRYSLNGKDTSTNFGSHVYMGPFVIHQTSVIHANWYFHGLKSKHSKAVAIVIR